MSIQLEKGLHSLLSGNTAAGARVFSTIPQRATMPAIRYQRITTLRNLALDGNVGVTAAAVQIDCLAENYTDAKTLADQVRVILHGYSGAWGTLTAHLAKLETENDFDEQDGDWQRYWVSQRYQIYTDMD